MNRNELIERIGIAKVDELERKNCDYMACKVYDCGQEFSSTITITAEDGNWDATVYYWQNNSDLDMVENLDELIWIPDRYELVPV